MSEEVRHPLFARLFDRLARDVEDKGAAEHRTRLLEGLSGRVLEIGAGNGLNFKYYPEAVDEVLAVEPEDYLRGKAVAAARDASVAVTVLDGLADAIPAPDGSFDAAVASLVLCSVPDQAGALAELRRVLRPGGELRFYEHVRADTPGLGRVQRVLAPAWPLVAGGCHLDRDTRGAIERAGFDVERSEGFRFKPSPLMIPTSPHVLGVARRPG